MLPDGDACALPAEIPVRLVGQRRSTHGGFFLNAAPARDRVPAADVTIVNSYELERCRNPTV